MRSIYYISILSGLMAVSLAGCAETPISKTNCWAHAGATVSASTKGQSLDLGSVSPQAPADRDVLACR